MESKFPSMETKWLWQSNRRREREWELNANTVCSNMSHYLNVLYSICSTLLWLHCRSFSITLNAAECTMNIFILYMCMCFVCCAISLLYKFKLTNKLKRNDKASKVLLYGRYLNHFLFLGFVSWISLSLSINFLL